VKKGSQEGVLSGDGKKHGVGRVKQVAIHNSSYENKLKKGYRTKKTSVPRGVLRQVVTEEPAFSSRGGRLELKKFRGVRALSKENTLPHGVSLKKGSEPTTAGWEPPLVNRSGSTNLKKGSQGTELIVCKKNDP